MEQVQEPSKEYFHNYYMFLVGIWGRNRTAKRKVFDFGDFNTELDLDTLKKITAEKLAELKVKTPYKYIVSKNMVTIERHSDHTMRGFAPFDAVELFRGER